MSLVNQNDVEAVETEVGKRLAAIGKKVNMVVNYDNFFLAPDLVDGYTWSAGWLIVTTPA